MFLKTRQLFGIQSVGPNFHQFCHKVLITKRWGQPFVSTMYPYESCNGTLASNVIGNNDTGWMAMQKLIFRMNMDNIARKFGIDQFTEKADSILGIPSKFEYMRELQHVDHAKTIHVSKKSSVVPGEDSNCKSHVSLSIGGTLLRLLSQKRTELSQLRPIIIFKESDKLYDCQLLKIISKDDAAISFELDHVSSHVTDRINTMVCQKATSVKIIDLNQFVDVPAGWGSNFIIYATHSFQYRYLYA